MTHLILASGGTDSPGSPQWGSPPPIRPGQDQQFQILIVEDNAELRETLADVLQYEGYRVATAANGREALAHLRSHPSAGLIVLDLMMPEMTGWDFRTEQRRDPVLAKIPVVVLSALPDVRQQAAGMDAAGCLQKPIDVGALLEFARVHCG